MQQTKLRFQFWSPVEFQGCGFDSLNYSDLSSKQAQLWPENGNQFQPHEDNREKNTQSHNFNKMPLPNQP